MRPEWVLIGASLVLCGLVLLWAAVTVTAQFVMGAS